MMEVYSGHFYAQLCHVNWLTHLELIPFVTQIGCIFDHSRIEKNIIVCSGNCQETSLLSTYREKSYVL